MTMTLISYDEQCIGKIHLDVLGSISELDNPKDGMKNKVSRLIKQTKPSLMFPHKYGQMLLLITTVLLGLLWSSKIKF